MKISIMKQIFLAIATLFISYLGYAHEVKVDPRVEQAFHREFGTVEANWIQGSGFYRVEFKFNDHYVNAFYSMDAELLGLTRNITVFDLPVNLQVGLKRSFDQFWVSDLFEVTKSNNPGYYITLKGSGVTLVLRALPGGDWVEVQRMRD